jgi:hypothetical protein
MSRINKQTKKAVLAKQFQKIRVSGSHGPSKTLPKHGKVKTWNAEKKVKNRATSSK